MPSASQRTTLAPCFLSGPVPDPLPACVGCPLSLSSLRPGLVQALLTPVWTSEGPPSVTSYSLATEQCQWHGRGEGPLFIRGRAEILLGCSLSSCLSCHPSVSTTQRLCSPGEFLTLYPPVPQCPDLLDEDNTSTYLAGSLGGFLCTWYFEQGLTGAAGWLRL